MFPRAAEMFKTRRAIVAFFVAPVMAPLVAVTDAVLVTLATGTTLTTSQEPVKELFFWLMMVSIFSLPVTYIALLVFGVPTIIVLDKLGRLSLFWLIVASAIEGVVSIFVYFWADAGFSWSYLHLPHTLLPRSVMGSTMAIGVAVAFWYMSGLHKSENSAEVD